MHGKHRVLLRAGVSEQDVLLVVVAQHLGGHLVGHRLEDHVALLQGQVALLDQPGQRDLDVDLVVGRVDAGGVVDRIGVDANTVEGGLDPAQLGATEVAALADHLDPQRVPVDADGVVGAVADLGVGLGGRLDVGADAAVPQQVDRSQQDRVDELGRGEVRRVLGQPQRGDHLGRHRYRLRGPVEDAATDRDQRAVVLGPRRTRAARTADAVRRRTSPRPASGRRRRAGGRTPRRAGCAPRGASRCRTRHRDMSPTPTTVNSCVWVSTSISRKCRLTDSHAPRAVIPIALWS